MLYVVKNDAIPDEIDVWTLNQTLLKEYVRQEERIYHKDCWIEEWDERVLRGTYVYPLDPTKELVVKENIVGECYLLTRGDYVKTINEFSIRGESTRLLPVENITNEATRLGLYFIFMKNKSLIDIIRNIRKRNWEIDPFTYQSRKTSIRKRKIK